MLRNYVYMYDLFFFDLFLGKGFFSCKGKKILKKIYVNDVLGYSFFLKLRLKVEIKIDIK